MGRRYVVAFSAVAVTTVIDFFEIKAASTKPLKLLAVKISQNTEVGDAQSEQLHILVKRAAGSYTSGSAGTTPTPVPLISGDAAASFTCEANNTTQASAGTGTLTTLLADADHVQAGWNYLPTPETLITCQAAEALVISLGTAPADSITFNGYAIVEED